MYQKLRTLFKANKYRLLIFILLAGASIISLGTLRLRYILTNEVKYEFLVWNLFLAWIPFIISYFTYTLTTKSRWIYFLTPLGAFFWLIFFPNAFYILTDLQHLRWAGGLLQVWYDVLVFIWFAWTALLLGIVSLFLMQEIVRRRFGRWAGWGFVVSVALLTSIGVYMGRFLRWNSWDILRYPSGILWLGIQTAQNPSRQALIFTALFSSFFLFLYITLYAFAHLFLEREPSDQQQIQEAALVSSGTVEMASAHKAARIEQSSE